MLKYYCSNPEQHPIPNPEQHPIPKAEQHPIPNPEQHPIPKAEVDNGQDSYFSTSAKD